jgi:hypothetical protein
MHDKTEGEFTVSMQLSPGESYLGSDLATPDAREDATRDEKFLLKAAL